MENKHTESNSEISISVLRGHDKNGALWHRFDRAARVFRGHASACMSTRRFTVCIVAGRFRATVTVGMRWL